MFINKLTPVQDLQLQLLALERSQQLHAQSQLSLEQRLLAIADRLRTSLDGKLSLALEDIVRTVANTLAAHTAHYAPVPATAATVQTSPELCVQHPDQPQFDTHVTGSAQPAAQSEAASVISVEPAAAPHGAQASTAYSVSEHLTNAAVSDSGTQGSAASKSAPSAAHLQPAAEPGTEAAEISSLHSSARDASEHSWPVLGSPANVALSANLIAWFEREAVHHYMQEEERLAQQLASTERRAQQKLQQVQAQQQRRNLSPAEQLQLSQAQRMLQSQLAADRASLAERRNAARLDLQRQRLCWEALQGTFGNATGAALSADMCEEASAHAASEVAEQEESHTQHGTSRHQTEPDDASEVATSAPRTEVVAAAVSRPAAQPFGAASQLGAREHGHDEAELVALQQQVAERRAVVAAKEAALRQAQLDAELAALQKREAQLDAQAAAAPIAQSHAAASEACNSSADEVDSSPAMSALAPLAHSAAPSSSVVDSLQLHAQQPDTRSVLGAVSVSTSALESGEGGFMHQPDAELDDQAEQAPSTGAVTVSETMQSVAEPGASTAGAEDAAELHAQAPFAVQPALLDNIGDSDQDAAHSELVDLQQERSTHTIASQHESGNASVVPSASHTALDANSEEAVCAHARSAEAQWEEAHDLHIVAHEAATGSHLLQSSNADSSDSSTDAPSSHAHSVASSDDDGEPSSPQQSGASSRARPTTAAAVEAPVSEANGDASQRLLDDAYAGSANEADQSTALRLHEAGEQCRGTSERPANPSEDDCTAAFADSAPFEHTEVSTHVLPSDRSAALVSEDSDASAPVAITVMQDEAGMPQDVQITALADVSHASSSDGRPVATGSSDHGTAARGQSIPEAGGTARDGVERTIDAILRGAFHLLSVATGAVVPMQCASLQCGNLGVHCNMQNTCLKWACIGAMSVWMDACRAREAGSADLYWPHQRRTYTH